MHIQPLYLDYQRIGGSVSECLFENGLCLPSGTAMKDRDIDRIITIIRDCWPM